MLWFVGDLVGCNCLDLHEEINEGDGEVSGGATSSRVSQKALHPKRSTIAARAQLVAI